MDFQPIIDGVERAVSEWHPMQLQRRTNWLYRVDALRPRDVREMDVLWELVVFCRFYATQFLVWGSSLRSLLSNLPEGSRRNNTKRLLDYIIHMSNLFLSEGYSYFSDYLEIAYYPSSNRITSSSMGCRFPALQRMSIDELGINECREMTGFSKSQLEILFRHLRIPERLRDVTSRRVFSGEEAFLHYMVYNRLGITKLQLSLYYFGGDPRRFSYSIRVFGKFLFHTFYHKISGDSMRMWVNRITDFRRAIWNSVVNTIVVDSESRLNGNELRGFRLEVPFDSFRVFGFLDDTSIRTTAPGIEARRRNGFRDDIQRAFYSGYFSHHGVKVQAVSLPNGMIGSVYIGCLRVSDSGLLNMSRLNAYLSSLFHEHHLELPQADNLLPVIYGDGVFPALPTVVPRYSHPSQYERRINNVLSSVRQNIEHLFA